MSQRNGYHTATAPPPTEIANRLPPQNRDAERGVLGACLRDNGLIDDVTQVLSVDDFYMDAHQKIFRVLLELHGDGGAIDTVVLINALNALGQVEDVGGYVYIAEIWESSPGGANAVYYAKIVREKSLLRSLWRESERLAARAFEGSQAADDLVAEAERAIFDIAERSIGGEPMKLDQAMSLAYGRIDSRKDGEASQLGIMTGFTDLDDITSGLHAGELTIIAARPSAGKTAFALALARGCAIEAGETVLFISLEQSKAEVAERLLACEAQVDSHKLRRGCPSATDIDRLIEAGGRIRKANLWIEDSPNQNILRIASCARRTKRRHGIRLLIIDYLQLIEPDNRREPREQQVSAISRRLKLLPRELGIPVVCLAQLNRSVESRTGHVPRLSDLRESGSIEQDADLVLLMHRPEAYQDEEGNGRPERPGEVDIIVAKQRNGPLGKATLTFVKQFYRFESMATQIPFA